jgi:phospholipase/carboxylesterase
MTDPELLTLDDWTFRLRPARGKTRRLLILLHGWMGDENSMWVLARNISTEYVILSPRAPLAAPDGGYSWREIKPDGWGLPAIDELKPAAMALMHFIERWADSSGVTAGQIDLMGFSQGAAMTYTLALLFPDRMGKIAALSGFLPVGGERMLAARPLAGKPVFVSHGRSDEMIPVDRARQAVAALEGSGAVVTYCESDIAHKVSKECLLAMEKFFQ